MWVVDTCILLDVLENDPAFGLASARFLQSRLGDGLTVSPVTMAELAPAFGGDILEQKRFLDLAGIRWDEPWTINHTEAAHAAWNVYVTAKRMQKIPKRPIADILIGAFASFHQGLITRNPTDFQPWFPGMEILKLEIES